MFGWQTDTERQLILLRLSLAVSMCWANPLRVLKADDRILKSILKRRGNQCREERPGQAWFRVKRRQKEALRKLQQSRLAEIKACITLLKWFKDKDFEVNHSPSCSHVVLDGPHKMAADERSWSVGPRLVYLVQDWCHWAPRIAPDYSQWGVTQSGEKYDHGCRPRDEIKHTTVNKSDTIRGKDSSATPNLYLPPHVA